MNESEQFVSSDFPFESKFVEVNGSKMHYLDEGQGDPILFLHGNPTSSYLWRNIIPHLTSQGRCIALDLIGMGKSDKPDIDYTFQDHYKYVEGFIEKLGLRNVTLVVHDWGSGLGFHYAHLNQENVKAIAFMEAIYKPFKWQEIPLQFRLAFRLMRLPLIGWLLVSVANIFLNNIVPQTTKRRYSKQEMAIIKSPYPTIKSRKPVRVWPQMVPFDGQPKDVYAIVDSYAKWLSQSDVPKLMLYAEPGGIIMKQDVEWIKANFKNLKSVFVGEGLHYVQEDHPHEIGVAIAKWYEYLS